MEDRAPARGIASPGRDSDTADAFAASATSTGPTGAVPSHTESDEAVHAALPALRTLEEWKSDVEERGGRDAESVTRIAAVAWFIHLVRAVRRQVLGRDAAEWAQLLQYASTKAWRLLICQACDTDAEVARAHSIDIATALATAMERYGRLLSKVDTAAGLIPHYVEYLGRKREEYRVKQMESHGHRAGAASEDWRGPPSERQTHTMMSRGRGRSHHRRRGRRWRGHPR